MFCGTRANQTIALESPDFRFCAGCNNLPTVLVRSGYFPASPYQPRTAFSFQVMKFYVRLDVSHKSPIDAFSEALSGALEDSGCNENDRKSFYSQLKVCLPWFDAFLRRVERMINTKLRSNDVEADAVVRFYASD